jgi:hypothetical protein
MSTHPEEGALRAHLDHGLGEREAAAITAHLATCADCAALASAIGERAAPVAATISPLPRSARRRHATWTALAAAGAALIALVTLPSLRAIAVDFLGLFRVQQVNVAPVNPGDLPERLGSSSQLEALLSDQVLVESRGEPVYVADAGQAADAAGFPVRLPSLLASPDEIAIQPAGHASIRVDLTRVRAVLREIDRDGAELPDALDGAEIRIDIPKSVRACYGDCPEQKERADARAGGGKPQATAGSAPDRPGILLIQLPNPAVSAPPGVPIDRIGAAFLGIMGMPREEAVRFSRNVDWAATLVIPIPCYSTSYQEVTVDGVPASLIRHTERHSYVLTWVKDGIIYSLAGSGEAARGLEIANSLR